jgi:hypothetical protein
MKLFVKEYVEKAVRSKLYELSEKPLYEANFTWRWAILPYLKKTEDTGACWLLVLLTNSLIACELCLLVKIE